MNTRTAKAASVVGMICLQVSAFPALVQALTTGEAAPLSSLLLVSAGLMFCMVAEWHYRIWAYWIGSAIGLAGQAAIVAVLLTRG